MDISIITKSIVNKYLKDGKLTPLTAKNGTSKNRKSQFNGKRSSQPK